jgi:membrane protease YdiL (CAAX protease family)
LLGTGFVGLNGASAAQRSVDTVKESWRGPGPLATFWTSLPWAILSPAPLLILFAPFGGFDALDVAARTAAIAMSTNLATTVVIAITVVGSGAATWTDLFGIHRDFAPALPTPDRRAGRVGDLAWGIALALPIVIAAALLSTLLIQSTGATPASPIPPSIDRGALLLNVLTAVLIAPIGEELLYRGVIAQAWGRQLGAARSIIFSALLFAFAHTLNVGGESVGGALAVAVVAFGIRLPLGLALGWLWVRRRSLLATITLHAAYNAVIVLAASAL